jgi:Flp pilus assembly protein TadB
MKLKIYAVSTVGLIGFLGFLYLVFNDLVLMIIFIIPIVFIVFYFLVPLIIKIRLNANKNDQLYFLVNIILNQLRTDKSLTTAFKSIVTFFPEELRNNYETYGVSPLEFLDLMREYFDSNYYEIFLNMIKIYDSKGGDIEERSKVLIDAIAFSKEVRSELIKTKLRKLSEFIIMWLLSFLVLLYLRLGLTAYYLDLLNTNFVFAIIGNFILFIISSYYAINSFSKVEESIR